MPYIHNSLEQQEGLIDINVGLNEMINSKLDWKNPREAFEALLREQ
jgi:hypothetical protein